jgi:PAS domain S-box-containing protein
VLLAAETIELSGEPCLIISHHDITTRKRAEEALRASEEKFHKVFHASPIGITLSRFSDGRYLEVNEAFCAMTGYSRAEVIGRTSLELGVWAKPEERAQLLARLTTQGFVRDYEASFRKQSGELGLVTLAVESITVNGEQCILVATQDITARKQAEDTLRRYTTRLEILREIDSAILTARSPEEIAAAALQGIRQLVPCLRATVSLFDFQAQQLFILVNSVKGETRFPTGARIPLAAIGDVTDLRQGRPRLIPDLLTFTPRTVVDEQLLLEGVRARLLLPLQFHGGLVGALVLSAGEPNVYTPEHIEIAAEVADQLAIAIQQARLYAETSEALRREQQLNEVAHTISSTLDLPTLLRQVVRLAVELVGAGESSMAVLSPNGEMFAYTFNYRADVSPQVVPKGTGLAWDIVAIGKPILLADYKTHPKALPAWINAGVQAFLGVPLIAGETVLGVLGLFHMTSERRFTERDVALAESIGQQAGVAIRNAQLFEATQRQLTELTVLQAVATVGAAVESEDDLLMYATPIISHAFLQEQCGVLLLNENRSGLYVHPSSRGISAERMQDLVPLGQGITGTVAASGQLMRVPDVRLEPVYRASTPETLSELCVPLKGSSQVLGVINVESPSLNAFSEADERLLVAVAGQLATALERLRAEQALRRLNAELERRVALLTALHENGLDLSTQLDLSELLHTIVERLMRLEGVTMSVLYLAEPQRTRLKLVVSHGLAPTYLVSYLNEGQGIGGQVFQRGELLVVPDYSQWPERVIDGPELPYRSVLGMPIKWRGQVLGVINLLDERVGRFGQPEIEMARLFADQAAAAILNAQLFEATRRQLSELTVLQAVAQAGTESETEASLLERVMLTIGDTLFHGRGSIMLLDTSAGVLRMAAAARAVSEESKRYVVPLGRGITGTVAQRGQPWRVPDVRQEPTYVAGGAMTLSELCVPLKVGEHVLGVINIESAQLDAFSEADERLLLTLAGQLAPAIERLRAEAALRQLNAELEQRVQERTAQLEAANKELEAFSYSVSHDLRSPLRSIDGFSQALLEDYEDQLDVDGQDYLRRVRAATQRMGQLIDDLLNLSRITRAELRQELVDLSALAQGVVAELQHAEPQRVVEVVIAAGLHGQGDARLLQIVLANLLGNAWKFTSKQTQARIELGAVVRDGHTTYFVRDNGAGFDMAYASKLFGAFQRLHALTEYSGTGIGLAIVQRIIHRHGGHVWAEGAVGQGATFYFTLTESNITGANHGGQNYFAG